MRGYRGEAISSQQAQQINSASDNITPPTEIEEVEQQLANAEETRSRIQKWRSRQRAEYEATLNQKRAEHEVTRSGLDSARLERGFTKSAHDVSQAELTHTKTQLADRDTVLEEANRLIKSPRNRVHAIKPAGHLRQENQEL